MVRPRQPAGHDDLPVKVREPSHPGQFELLHTNVYRLRRNLEADPSHPVYLAATPGVGYYVLPPADDEP